MKKQFATFLISISCFQSLMAFNIEVGAAYDYFRGMPEGSWNGNTGADLSLNFGTSIFECLDAQLGGSYGFYNWSGRENVVFKNPRAVEQKAFVTAGFSSSFGPMHVGLVYDRLFAKHYSIYALKPSFDQLRFQAGYQLFCEDEIGLWGTIDLTRSHKTALGVPIHFKAIGQLNAFWTHHFDNDAHTTIWLGSTYRNSYMYDHKTPGIFIAGFSFRVPLTECLAIDSHGSYMWPRSTNYTVESRNYGANICVGLIYSFGDGCSSHEATYMPLANNSNFLVDINANQ